MLFIILVLTLLMGCDINVQCHPDVTISTTPSCPLNCNEGQCKLTSNGPRCICLPQFSGTHCEFNRCAHYCKNRGTCYVDLISSKDGIPPVKCQCPPQWTGERCETPLHVCEGRCYNNGTCSSPKPGIPQCNCQPGFTGPRCEFCLALTCQNGGICSKDTGNDKCNCPEGYSGRNCQLSDCDGYCHNKGSCKLTPHGPQCTCLPGYSGKKCDEDGCNGLCKNGGKCKVGGKQPECECPPLFSGRRCEVDKCKENPYHPGCLKNCPSNPCEHDGQCVIYNGLEKCRCTKTWGGDKCTVYMGNENPCMRYCQNDGLCTVAGPQAQPECYCVGNWIGKQCEKPSVCADHCLNGGTCSVSNDIPYCTCTSGYTGNRCDVVLNIIDSDKLSESSESNSGSVLTGLLIFFGLLVVILAGLTVGYITLKRRKSKPFTHERLDDNNLEISNPMYNQDIEDDVDPIESEFSLEADRSSNFVNPIYEQMYTGGPGAAGSSSSKSEEKTGLLEHANEEIPSTGVDD